MLEVLPDAAVVVNDRRQILAANHRFCAAAGAAGEDAIRGDRPGDALQCREAANGSDGCGTAPGCTNCGAGSSFARLERGERGPIREECRILRQGSGGDEAIDAEAGLNRLPDGTILMVLRDIGAEKRRQVLERIFFHDVLNTASNVVSLADMVSAGSAEAVPLLCQVGDQLIEEIRQQRALLQAERGELVVTREPIDVAARCAELVGIIRGSPVAAGRSLRLEVPPLALRSDPVLLGRVLGNLLRNACEATPAGGEVVLSAAAMDGGWIRIAVANPGELPPAVAQQVFHRSFTTKGGGRGLGTWSVKLFTERYLGGRVGFTSGGGRTEFAIELPPA